MITEIYAWIISDPSGNLGLMGFRMPDGQMMQAVSSKRELMQRPLMYEIAKETSRQTGFPVCLKRFVIDGKDYSAPPNDNGPEF